MRIMHVRALLAPRVPLILRVNVMKVPSVLQGDSLKRLLQAATAGAVVAMIVGFNVGLAIADGPAKLNVAPSCDAAAPGAISLGRNAEACMDDEREARDLLTKNWSQYSRAHKTQCVGMTTRGGPSSYVELISCLDIMKDAAAIYKADPLFGNFRKNAKGNPPHQRANRSPKTNGASSAADPSP